MEKELLETHEYFELRNSIVSFKDNKFVEILTGIRFTASLCILNNREGRKKCIEFKLGNDAQEPSAK